MAHGAFWSLIGSVAGRLFALAVAVITARLLGKVGFGELGMVQSTIGLMGTFAGFGLGMTTTKYVAELKEKDPERTRRIIALSNLVALVSGSLMALVCVAAAPWLAQKTMNAPQLVPELQMGAALLFVSALLGVQTGTLSGFQAFRTIARINFFQGFLSFPLALALIYFWGLRGAVLYLIASALIGVLLSSRALSREYAAARLKAGFRGAWAERRVLWDFSFPALMSGAMVAPVTWAANAILVNQPHGYAELGLLNAANQWRTLLLFLPGVLQQVAFPILSSALGNEAGASKDYENTVVWAQSLTIAIVFPVGVCLMFLCDWVMKIYGKSFLEGSPILIGSVCAAMIASIGNISGSVIQAQGRMWLGLFINLSWGIFLIIFVIIFAPFWGANSLAFGSAIGYLLITVWVFLYLSKELPEGFLSRIFKSLGFLVLLTSLCYFLSSSQRLTALLPIFIITILFTFFVFTAPQLWIKVMHYLALRNNMSKLRGYYENLFR